LVTALQQHGLREQTGWRARRARIACTLVLGVLIGLAALGIPASANGARLLGVQTHLLWGDVSNSDMERQLQAAKAGGSRIVRVDVGWATLQPDARGQWSDWALERLDRVVRKAKSQRVKLLLTLWQTPCWASSAPAKLRRHCSGEWWNRDVQLYAPQRFRDYAHALAFLADRYGSDVKAWEIWTEPNSRSCYRDRRMSVPRSYAKLVRTAYPLAKRANPRATIVAGGLMWADYEFTRRLYEAGIKGSFDALSIHPYSDDRSPLARGRDEYIRGSYIRGVPAVHRTMRSYGDRRPLWLTEFGWNTSTIRGSSGWLNGVSARRQAIFVGQALKQLREWRYVRAAIYYELIDTGKDRGDALSNFGLLQSNYSKKPAYGAFRSSVRLKRGSRGHAAGA
jgi:hypothetical protein